MGVLTEAKEYTYDERIVALRETKKRQTAEKWARVGYMDYDDWALVLPPPEMSLEVHAISGSGLAVTDVLLKGFKPKSNHPSGGFFGPRASGENFRALLVCHPVYIDSMSSLAGAYMVNFLSYRSPGWNPDFEYSRLEIEHRKYGIEGMHAIGSMQHFCQDMTIGYTLGWNGILRKIRYHREHNAPRAADFYAGLEEVVLGIQDWIRRHAEAARDMAKVETHPRLCQNLEEIAAINEWIITEPPRTFREAVQWTLWYQLVARMYNGSGSLGKIDQLLYPFYERDLAAGILTDEDTVFHLACLLVRDTGYSQLGGPDATGKDVTNRLSYLVLEAAHRLRIPANLGVCVGRDVDPRLMRRGVEIQFEDKTGIPKFLGVDNTIAGFMRNGFPEALARSRAYAGCHWFALPGREYTMNDFVKLNLIAVMEVALREMMADPSVQPSMAELWHRFQKHLRRVVDVLAEGMDFHLEHMHDVLPELVLDLLCYGPIEKGLDASNGGVEYYNLCMDSCGLGTTADSFAAMAQRIEKEHRLTWQELLHFLDTNWVGPEGERARLMMQTAARYGSGGSLADQFAGRISDAFVRTVKERPTPGGRNMIPGHFSWALTLVIGRKMSASPNGRRAGEPISQGANPHPGFRKDGAATALAAAVASVQCNYGNPAPLQMELDPGTGNDEEGLDKVIALIQGHMAMGGTEINLNVVDAQILLAAHKDPTQYPDLVVRVTGFSAFFASLSPEMRQLIIDRVVTEDASAC